MFFWKWYASDLYHKSFCHSYFSFWQMRTVNPMTYSLECNRVRITLSSIASSTPNFNSLFMFHGYLAKRWSYSQLLLSCFSHDQTNSLSISCPIKRRKMLCTEETDVKIELWSCYLWETFKLWIPLAYTVYVRRFEAENIPYLILVSSHLFPCIMGKSERRRNISSHSPKKGNSGS